MVRIPPSCRRLSILTSFLCLMLCSWALQGSPAKAQSYSSGFLDVLNEACFAAEVPPQRGGSIGRRGQVRVELANSTRSDISRVCVYDLTCGRVVFSGPVIRSKRVAFTVCSNSRARGQVLLLDPFGTLIERNDLASPATIQLGTR